MEKQHHNVTKSKTRDLGELETMHPLLSRERETTQIVLSHAPPVGVLDMPTVGAYEQIRHIGSPSLLASI